MHYDFHLFLTISIQNLLPLLWKLTGTKKRENSCFDVLHFLCLKNPLGISFILITQIWFCYFFTKVQFLTTCSFLIGYILQQCALANNIQHFKMVMESVSYKEEDLMYTDPETGIFVIDRHSYRYMYR